MAHRKAGAVSLEVIVITPRLPSWYFGKDPMNIARASARSKRDFERGSLREHMGFPTVDHSNVKSDPNRENEFRRVVAVLTSRLRAKIDCKR